MRVPLGAFLSFLATTGCEDIRRFSGHWAGPVSADPAHQQGFEPGAQLRATVGSTSRSAIDASVVLPRQTAPLTVAPIAGASADLLGELSLPGEPLRTYLGWVTPPGAAPILTILSLFPDDRVDVRLVRGPNELYGVFSLRRAAAGSFD